MLQARNTFVKKWESKAARAEMNKLVISLVHTEYIPEEWSIWCLIDNPFQTAVF